MTVQAEWDAFSLYRWLHSVLLNPNAPVVGTAWVGATDEAEERRHVWHNGLTYNFAQWPEAGSEPLEDTDRVSRLCESDGV